MVLRCFNKDLLLRNWRVFSGWLPFFWNTTKHFQNLFLIMFNGISNTSPQSQSENTINTTGSSTPQNIPKKTNVSYHFIRTRAEVKIVTILEKFVCTKWMRRKSKILHKMWNTIYLHVTSTVQEADVVCSSCLFDMIFHQPKVSLHLYHLASVLN